MNTAEWIERFFQPAKVGKPYALGRVLDNESTKGTNAQAALVSAPLPASKKTQERAEEKLEPSLEPSLGTPNGERIDAPTELRSMRPLADLTTPAIVKRVTYDSPLSCLLSFYGGIRLLAYPDGSVVVRDPQGREGLAKYVAAYEAQIWKEMTGERATVEEDPLTL